MTTVAPETQALIHRMVGDLERLTVVSRYTLARLIREEPDYVPVLASVVGFTQERLKRQLQHHLGSAAWITRSRKEPHTIIDLLDDEYDLVARVNEALNRSYTLSDVLIAKAGSRSTAGDAIDAGRYLENAVESVIADLGLGFQARTRFEGVRGATAPCDFGIPSGGQECRIAIAVKGFDSTGSKLTASVDEVRHMANTRVPSQYVFAVVDGVGWKGRVGDLARLVEMVPTRRIEGMFPLEELTVFRNALRDAAVRVGLLAP